MSLNYKDWSTAYRRVSSQYPIKRRPQ